MWRVNFRGSYSDNAIPAICFEKQFEASPSPHQYRARSWKPWRALVNSNARGVFNRFVIDSGQSRAPCIVFVTSLCNSCGKKASQIEWARTTVISVEPWRQAREIVSRSRHMLIFRGWARVVRAHRVARSVRGVFDFIPALCFEKNE